MHSLRLVIPVPSPRAAARSCGLTLLALLIALPALAQRTPNRERGWTPQQTHNWVEALGNQSLGRRAALNECADVVDFTNRRDAILNGNRITTQILNFGSISSPGNTITDIIWNGLGYGYEFGPFVAAEVPVSGPNAHPDAEQKRDENGNVVTDENGNPIYVVKIVSDGIVSSGGERSPDGREAWGWQPIPCAQPVGSFEGLAVVNPNSSSIPTSDAPDNDRDGKPDSWPDAWYNETLQEYVWPGALQQGASNADQEALYFMNDYANREFPYYPFPGDTLRRGLGLEVEVRIYQWANPLAEDAMFLVYKITNKSEQDLDNVIFGMWGDPHVGGPGDWADDLAFFDRSLNMVFAYDADGRSDIAGRTPGYFGYKFLESPGRGNECIGGRGANAATCEASGGTFFPGNGIDDDGDGLIDESWTDGIDNDGDWNPETDDVGIDGIPNSGDEGEGDGIPTAGDPFDITKPGEPNFEYTDIDESDMIGLTSFASPAFAGARISNDRQVWDFVTPGRFDNVPATPGDYVFVYGSGGFPLRAGETKRFSIALLMGENLEDLRLNAETVQDIYEVGYRFARPPDKPTVRAVPGDRQVTLYWDDVAERSVDPLSRDQDFEGYVIYRSTDHEFSDQQTITDVNGSRFLFRPLTSEVGVEAKFDLDNEFSGPSAVPYPRRGVAYDLGDNTGLVHTYVDSNNVINGQTYYYSVVAYDRGYLADPNGAAGGIPPSETSKTITYLPTTDQYIFDRNTVAVTPRPRAAGYVSAHLAEPGIAQTAGTGTGDVWIEIQDEMAVRDGGRYTIAFDRQDGQTVYSVINEIPVTVNVAASLDRYRSLGYANVQPETFSLRAGSRALEPGTDYELDADAGSVLVTSSAGVANGDTLSATFTYAPLVNSPRLAGEEANIVFDGLHVFAQDERLALNRAESGWIQGGSGVQDYTIRVATAGPGRTAQPYDYEIRFSNEIKTTGFSNNLPLPFEIINLTRANQQITAFVPDNNGNGQWDANEQITFLEEVGGVQNRATWEVLFNNPERKPASGDVFYVRTDKPFTAADRFTFETVGVRTDADIVRSQMRDIYVVPNPYVATNEIEPRNPVSRSQRGDRRLYFANVPPQCTIRIYTLAGELVDTIEHNSTADDGKAFWDLRSRDNMSIAYGLYIYHVESPEGTFTGKFAVIK